MNEPNYYKEFGKSGINAGLLIGMAAAFAAANPLVLMAAAAVYALTWVYAPTSHLFVRRIQGRLKLAADIANQDVLGEFVKRRDSLLERLNEANMQRYNVLSNTCAEVSNNDPDNTLINGKLQDLLWTYLKMLLMQQGIETYLSETDAAAIDANLKTVEDEIKTLTSEQQRLRASKDALRTTLVQHKKSLLDARENLDVLNSEISRLEHEIQLLRADAIANRNSDFLSAKIDASVGSLQESKAILQSMSNVSEMSLDIPTEAAGLGFKTVETVPPALPEETVPKIKNGRVRA